MHIPDGFLNNGTASSLIVAAAGAVVFAANKVRQAFFVKEKIAVLKTPEGLELGGSVATKLTQYGRSKIFKMVLLGLFVFGAQLFDFFIIQGFPVHFLGGALAAILLGPLEGFLVVSTVLTVQCLLLGDGGLMALGANIFNMGVLGTIGSYYLYRFFCRCFKKDSLAVFLGTFSGVLLTAAFYGGELIFSNYGGLSFGRIMAINVGVAFLEGLITLVFLRVFSYHKN